MKKLLFGGFLTWCLLMFGAQVAGGGVDGQIIWPLRVLTGDGSAANPAWSFWNDRDTGLIRTAANTIAVVNGGTGRFSLSTVLALFTVPVSVPNGNGAGGGVQFASGAGIYSGGAVAGDIAFVSGGGTRGEVTGTDIRAETGVYIRTGANNAGAPTATDCDGVSEVGRIALDTTNNRFYVCNSGARGWDYVSLTD